MIIKIYTIVLYRSQTHSLVSESRVEEVSQIHKDEK